MIEVRLFATLRDGRGKILEMSPDSVSTADDILNALSIPAEDDDPERYRREGLDETAIRETYRRIAEDVIREIEFMQSVKDSPNIVGIEDYKVVGKKDSPGWDIFIRMELLTPLTEWLCDRETSEADAVRLGTDLCRALETCDRMQIQIAPADGTSEISNVPTEPTNRIRQVSIV